MKKTIQLVFAVLIAIAVILLIAEWGIGYSDYRDNYRALIAEKPGENYIRLNQHAANSTKNALSAYEHLLGEGDVLTAYDLRTDSNGFILPSKIHEQADLDLFFIGGSTTECETVKEKLRFPFLTGRILEEQTGLKINSYNAGVGGNNSLHSLNILINKILPLNPDIAVFHHNINDIVYLCYYGSYWTVDQKNAQTINLDYSNKVNPKEYSYYPVLRQHFNSALNIRVSGEESEESSDRFSGLRGETIQINTKSIKRQYRNALETFINVCLSWETNPVLMTQVLNAPLIHQHDTLPDTIELTIPENPFDSIPNPEFLGVISLLHAAFNNIIRNTASEYGLLLIDLEELIPNNESGYLSDQLVHYNDSGSVFVAKVIANQLMQIIPINPDISQTNY